MLDPRDLARLHAYPVRGPEAAEPPITELGLERDGFRGSKLVINARMGGEEGAEGESWAGIYLTGVPAR